MPEVDIISYSPEYAEDFKRISYQWIDQYFGIEQEDRELMENHKARILDTGGAILLAKIEQEIVGVCALIKHNNQYYELAKMGVLPKYQGLKIGKRLAEAILNEALDLGAEKVFLESSSKLNAALALYHKLGFRPDPDLEITPYSRCNVQLVVSLQD